MSVVDECSLWKWGKNSLKNLWLNNGASEMRIFIEQKIEMNKWEKLGTKCSKLETEAELNFHVICFVLFCCALLPCPHRFVVIIVACSPVCLPALCSLCSLAHVKMHLFIEFIIVFCNWIVAWFYVVNNSSCHKLNKTRPKQERKYSYVHIERI